MTRPGSVPSRAQRIPLDCSNTVDDDVAGDAEEKLDHRAYDGDDDPSQ